MTHTEQRIRPRKTASDLTWTLMVEASLGGSPLDVFFQLSVIATGHMSSILLRYGAKRNPGHCH